MFVWLYTAPKYDPSDKITYQQVTDFDDSVISTSSVHPIVENVEKFQFHKCTFTCKKYAAGIVYCRINPNASKTSKKAITLIAKD